MRRNQALLNSRSVPRRIVDLCNDVFSRLGIEWTAGLIAAIVVSLFALSIRLSDGEPTAAEELSNIPDHTSADCHAKLVRSYLRESSVDRYERLEMENALKSGDNCKHLPQ